MTIALLSRRDLLHAAGVGVAASVLPLTRAATPTPTVHGTARSVILLWMAGGVTHIDSFDPKPDAPEEIRGTLGTIATTLPGVRFCEVMPCLAKQTDKLALVRTFSSGNDDHFLSQAMALSGRRVTPLQIDTEPNVGAVVSRLHGPRDGFPGYIAVPGTTRPGPPPRNLFVGGWLGQQYAPFPTGGKPKNEDFTAQVKEDAEDEFTKQGVKPVEGLDSDRLRGRVRCASGSTRVSAMRSPPPAWAMSIMALSTCCCRRRCDPPSTWRGSRRRSATATARRRSARAACWRGDWSKPGARS